MWSFGPMRSPKCVQLWRPFSRFRDQCFLCILPSRSGVTVTRSPISAHMCAFFCIEPEFQIFGYPPLNGCLQFALSV